MKIVFMGNPDFSAIVLEKMNSAHKVSLVVTSPDKPTGRGFKLTPSPLKAKAIELGIDVFECTKVSKEGLEFMRDFAPDVVITAAFGQILSEAFLAIPRYGVLNVHASLLPKYRGSSPIQQAILNGDSETGITIMRTVKEVDAGDILLKKATPIGDDENAGELFDRLALLGGDAICEAIDLLCSGGAEFVPQEHSEATYSKMISKDDGQIDFSKGVRELNFFVRGMTPWPSAYTHLDGKLLKVVSLKRVDYSAENAVCGEVVCANSKDGLIVKVADGCVRLCEVKLEGTRQMRDSELLMGRKIPLGTVL